MFQLIKALTDRGAEKLSYFSDYVTHCILGENYSENEVSEAKDVFEVPAVTQDWVSMSVYCNRILPYPFYCFFFSITHAIFVVIFLHKISKIAYHFSSTYPSEPELFNLLTNVYSLGFRSAYPRSVSQTVKHYGHLSHFMAVYVVYN